jgi:hypothetical protein
MSKKKVYISLPISGYDLEERKETALAMEVKLRGHGYDVFNPFNNGLSDEASTYEHMKADIKALLDCDVIMFMYGWNRSAGCKCELDVATAIGLDVWFEGMETLKI